MAHTYHTRDMERLGGNMKLLPKTGALLAFTAMASLGLPGLAGFWGEFMALLGAYNPLPGLNVTIFRSSMVAGAIGTVLTAGYLLWMLQRVNLGEPKEEWIDQELHDADNYELVAWIPLVILTVLFIVFFERLKTCSNKQTNYTFITSFPSPKVIILIFCTSIYTYKTV